MLRRDTTIQRKPSQGMVWTDFSIFEEMKKFFCRHKKCIEYPFDSRAHLKTVLRSWFPTSDRLQTRPIPYETIRSEQYHKSTMFTQADATCPCITSDTAYFRFVTLFSSKRTRQSTKSNRMRAGWALRSLTLRDVSIQKRSSRISQLSITQNVNILQDTNL